MGGRNAELMARPSEPSRQLRSGESTALFELTRLFGQSPNAALKRLAEKAQQLGLATTIVVQPAADLRASFAAANGRALGEQDVLDGFYDPSTDTIYLAQENMGTEFFDKVLAHESAHALTETAIQRVMNPTARFGQADANTRRFVAEMQEIFEEAKLRITDPTTLDMGWRTNLSEFVAESWANPRFQQMLANVPSTRKDARAHTILADIWATISEWFGLSAGSRSLLHDILASSEQVMEWSVNETQAGRTARRVVPSARTTGTSGRVASMLDRMRERSQNPNVPRDPQAQTEIEDVAAVEAEAEELARPAYYGERKEGDRIIVRGQVVPAVGGGYFVTTDLGFSEEVNTLEEALQKLRENGIRATRRSEVNAQQAGVTFVDAYGKSTPTVRAIAKSVRDVVARVNPAMGETLGTEVLGALNWLQANISSQHHFVDRMDEAITSITGENPQLGLQMRNSVRQASVVGRYDELGEMGRRIALALRNSGVADDALASQYLVARHVRERNARLAGTLIPNGGGMTRGEDVTGFTFNGLRGNEAADAFIASLTPQQKTVLDAVASTYAEAKQHTLAFQLQTGMISHDDYLIRGGFKPDGTRDPRAWTDYIPLKDYRATDLLGRSGGRIGSGQGGRDMDYTRQMFVAFLELEQQVKTAHRNESYRSLADAHRAHPQLLDARIAARKAVPKLKARDGDEVTWAVEDFHEDDSLVFFENGVRKTITFFDPATKAYLKAKQNTPGLAEKTLGRVTHIMAQTRTTFAPAFWAQSVSWDVLMAVLGMENAAQGTLTPAESLKVSRRTLALLPRSIKYLAQRAGSHGTTDAFLRVYGANGGGVAPGSRTGLDEVMTEFNQNVNPLNKPNSTSQLLKATWARTFNVLHSTEDMTRFSAFQAYIEHKAGRKFASYDTLTAWTKANPAILAQALDVSRKITGDFSDKGAMSWPRALFMFFGPAVAGARQITGIAQTRTGQLGMGALFVLGGALAANALGDEEDEDEDGGSIYLRREGRGRSIAINDVLQFPLAPEGRAAFTAGESLAAASMGKISWGEASTRIAGAIVDTFSPLNLPDADVSAEASFVGLSPAIVQPLIVAFMGVDSFGNDTELDVGLVRDINGDRVVMPSNAERGRNRDPQEIKDAALWARDTLGIDLYPGRIYEVSRSIGGSSLTFLQRAAGEEGPGGAITRAYQSRYNAFAIRDEFDAKQAEFEQELRGNQRRDNAFVPDPLRVRNMLLLREADELARKVQINGYTQAELRRAHDAFSAAGNDEGVKAVETLLDNLQQMQSIARARALREVRMSEL